MTKAAPQRIHTGNRILDDSQKNGRDATKRLNSMVFDGGRLLEGLSFSAGIVQTLAHGLGRKASGWIEVYDPDVPSAAHVGLFATANPSPLTSDTHVTVTPTSTGTCSLFIY